MQMSEKSKDGKGREASDAVSRRLRQYYQAVKDEPIPDRFLDLLEKLDEADRAQRAGKGAGNERQEPGNDA